MGFAGLVTECLCGVVLFFFSEVRMGTLNS